MSAVVCEARGVTVIRTSRAMCEIARRLLPATERIVSGAERTYFIYQADGGNYAYRDIDGEELIACRSFDTLAEAEAWVRDDSQVLP